MEPTHPTPTPAWRSINNESRQVTWNVKNPPPPQPASPQQSSGLSHSDGEESPAQQGQEFLDQPPRLPNMLQRYRQ